MHLRSVSMLMPSSFPTSALGRPCSVTIRIAPALNAACRIVPEQRYTFWRFVSMFFLSSLPYMGDPDHFTAYGPDSIVIKHKYQVL